MELPVTKVEGLRKDPGLLVIAGFQKSGKTTGLASLDDNLIIDLEGGTDYMSAMKVRVNNLRELSEVVRALAGKEKRYRFITIDTGTKLEDLALELAVINYRKMPIGKRWEGVPKDLLNLANGLGYSLERNAYLEILSWLKPYCQTLILVCHIKNSSFQKDGEEISVVDISLTGQLKTIVAAEADAIGMFYRKKSQSILSFRGGESFLVGARPKHLENRDFVIIDSEGDGLEIDWSGVFPS